MRFKYCKQTSVACRSCGSNYVCKNMKTALWHRNSQNFRRINVPFFSRKLHFERESVAYTHTAWDVADYGMWLHFIAQRCAQWRTLKCTTKQNRKRNGKKDCGACHMEHCAVPQLWHTERQRKNTACAR